MLSVHRLARQSGVNLHDKNLLRRLAGRFYTPKAIADVLIAQAMRSLRPLNARTLKVIDPFCGDGRLIVAFLHRAAAEGFRGAIQLDLWDCDAEAVARAREAVSSTGRTLGLKIRVASHVWDTFEEAPGWFGGFDLVVTNPPWETLKPDKRELRNLSPIASGQLIEELRRQDQELAKRFPTSQPSKRFSGWGANLSRIGSEVALRLLADRGAVCSMVVPASLFGDQVSGPLRGWMMQQFALKEIALFPAEGRFFDFVDQPICAFTARMGGKTGRIAIKSYDNAGVLAQSVSFDPNAYSVHDINHALPIQFGLNALHVWKTLAQHQRFAELERSDKERLWAGRELDETDKRRYLAETGSVRFAKGIMVSRYKFDPDPDLYVRESAVRIPATSYARRIAWRDVSRPTQRRRMQATIIPEGWVTGNSLNVAGCKATMPYALESLLGLMNSACFEFQVRSISTTAHISLGTVRHVRLPEFLDGSMRRSLGKAVESCLESGETTKVEALAAKAYGLSIADYEDVLAAFSKLADSDREDLLRAFRHC